MKNIRELLRLRLVKESKVDEIASACNIGRTTVDEYQCRVARKAVTEWPLIRTPVALKAESPRTLTRVSVIVENCTAAPHSSDHVPDPASIRRARKQNQPWEDSVRL